ncbi:hypothetical protein PBV52_03055 [Streptomyces sp. T12]|uniref:hypothetical protein n=1 Tax=Streptomyces sp. T12 TaxID=477697 RepID=UPI002366799E|nr:hypothetical protein [Streptomyces sp. T12]WDF35835.1 hypothetical protein PBV52_03055 [Streptomyces sp. T12]
MDPTRGGVALCRPVGATAAYGGPGDEEPHATAPLLACPFQHRDVSLGQDICATKRRLVLDDARGVIRSKELRPYSKEVSRARLRRRPLLV